MLYTSYQFIRKNARTYNRMGQLKIIKGIVFLFTFLLIFGLMALIGIFTLKIRNSGTAPLADINLREPQGSAVKQIASDGDLLHILVSGGGKPDRIIIFDLAKKQKLSNINIY